MTTIIHNISPFNEIVEGYTEPKLGSKYWFILTEAIVHDDADTHNIKMSNWSTYYPLVRKDGGDLNIPVSTMVEVTFDGSWFQVEGTYGADLSGATGIIGLANGGTGADLSATGPGVLVQQSSGATVSLINPTSPIELASGALRLNASAADRYLYSTGSDTWTEGTLTAFARTLLDDANAAAALTTLGAAAFSHTHAASDITSGTIATARLGSGTANSGTFLRGDQSWQAVSTPSAIPVPETEGGTGESTYTTGDLLYASAADTLSKLGIGSAGEVLQVVGGNVSWETDIAGVSGGRRILGGTAGGHHLVLMPEPGGQGRVYIGDDSSSSGGTYYNGVSSRWRWTIGTASPGDGMQDHTFFLAPDDGNSAVDPGDGIRFEFRAVNSVVTEFELGFLEFEAVDSTSGSESSVARIGVADGSTAVAQIEIEPGEVSLPSGVDLTMSGGNLTITGVITATQSGQTTLQRAGTGVTQVLQLRNNVGTGAVGDGCRMVFSCTDDGGNAIVMSRFSSELTDATDGSEDASWYIETVVGGTLNKRLSVEGLNTVIGTAAVSTSATDGFLYITGCAGTPSGTPTSHSGRYPLLWDSTNDSLYVYDGGWNQVGGGGSGLTHPQVMARNVFGGPF